MRKIFRKSTLSAEELNSLYAEGYRYYCDGCYRTLDTTDPWSGMPNTTNDVFVFDKKKEAEIFAEGQLWVFNPDIHATVREIPPHTETPSEWRERMERERLERAAKKEAEKARKAAIEKAKADAAGLTVAEYRKAKARKTQEAKLKKEILELEKELAEKKAKFENLSKQ